MVVDDDEIVGVWCDEGSLEGNRRLDDEEGVSSEACDDNDAADGNDDEYGNVLVQPVVVAVLPIGSTGEPYEGSQDDNGGDGASGGGTDCGALDVEEALATIATLDVVERGKDGGGCWYFDALGSTGGPDGNGPLPVSWE